MRQPVLFLGHGSPMNALATNAFTRKLGELGKQLGKPKAVLCISAHWLTAGTWVTHMPAPRTIHDFYGFPQALFDVRYPAPGSVAVAERVRALLENPRIQLDDAAWGLDHGTWSVLRHVYPDADVPVVQLSLDMAEPGLHHLALGQKLRPLRDEGVLLVGSGNIVHNLRLIDWNPAAPAKPWAVEFDRWVADRIIARDFTPLAQEFDRTEAGRLSVPTPDHYLPLLYVLGASDEKDAVHFDYEAMEHASLSMRSVRFARQ